MIESIYEKQFCWKDFLDAKILVSFLVVFFCQSTASLVAEVIKGKTEDQAKLKENYDELVKKYSREQKNMVRCIGDDGKLIPVICLHARNISKNTPYRIEIQTNGEDVIRRYSIPRQISDNSQLLFDAHSTSQVYNNTNIRVDDLQFVGDKVELKYEWTTYFDSLLTNRAADFLLKDGRTIREIYEPGPMLRQLSDSKLSNHLGFNGLVELADGKIIFVKRGNKVSIAKSMWSQSIGASLKTMYCLDDNNKMTVKGISEAIRLEIQDELKIEIDSQEDMTKCIFAFYRDLVECGKPQFLFYYKTDRYDEKSFENHFREVMGKLVEKRDNRKRVTVDGTKFAYYTLDELRRSIYTPGTMTTPDGEKHRMMPSSIASVVLFLQNIS